MILIAVGGSCLKVSSSGGSSVNETSCEISAKVKDMESAGPANDNGDDLYVRF